MIHFAAKLEVGDLFAQALVEAAKGRDLAPQPVLDSLRNALLAGSVALPVGQEAPILVSSGGQEGPKKIYRLDVLQALQTVAGTLQFVLGATLVSPVLLGAGFLGCLLSFRGLVKSLPPSAALLVAVLYQKVPKRGNSRKIPVRTLRKYFFSACEPNRDRSGLLVTFEAALSELQSLGVIDRTEGNVELVESVYFPEHSVTRR